MKRLLLVLLLCVACGREQRDEGTRTATLPSNPPVPRSARTPPFRGITNGQAKSTPAHCAGNGSYGQALDCFRFTSGFHFTLPDAQGEMTRPTLGMERVQFKSSDGTTWVGEAKHSGVVWTRNGTHDPSPPEITNRVWQRTTMVLDPQKREMSPQLAGVETIRGEACNHFHFTNANSGEANDVWVSTGDGRIVRWKMGSSTLEIL